MSPVRPEIVLTPAASVRDAMQAIDRGGQRIALVVDGAGVLLATVTDGDVRRGVLDGLGVDAPVTAVMHRAPQVVRADAPEGEAIRLMRERRLQQVPVVDEGGRVVGIVSVEDAAGLRSRETRVVIMAGGMGVRLRPLTETVPKPMLPIGGRPLLETIVRNLAEQGFRRITLSVNYLSNVIRDHFADGTQFDVDITYVEEKERLGTAGALRLLERPAAPFLVMNGDLVTTVRFDQLLAFHAQQGAAITVGAREHRVQVPYGVLDTDGARLTGMTEKPEFVHRVNAGIYAVDPAALDHLAPDGMVDMPTLVEGVMAAGRTAAVFPLREYWLDIGQFDDLRRAEREFDNVFGGGA